MSIFKEDNFELEKESLVLEDNVKRLQSGTLSDFGEKLDEKLLEGLEVTIS